MEQDISILNDFVVEAQEHLENIEDEILTLSGQKDEPDAELINKVFRAVHSIKGGAGFLQLTNIAELSHVMETVLSSIRMGAMAAETEATEALLAGVDRLGAMLEDVAGSNDLDIDDVIDRIRAIIEGRPSVKEALRPEVPVTDEQGRDVGFDVSRLTLDSLPKGHEYLFVLRYDLSQFTSSKGKSPVALIKKLQSCGDIVDVRLEPPKGDLTQGLPEGPLTYEVLYSTILGPDVIQSAVDLPEEAVTVVDLAGLQSAAAPAPADEDEEEILLDFGSAPGEFEAPAPPPPESEDDLIFELPVTPEMVDQFTAEADELLGRFEQCIVAVSEDPSKAGENLPEAFRLMHSFKGNCGLLGLSGLEEISHKLETVLEICKSREEPPDEGWSLVLQALDGLKDGVADLSGGGRGAVADVKALSARLDDLIQGPRPAPARPSAPAPAPSPAPEGRKRDRAEAHPPVAPKSVERHDIRVDLEKLDVLINLVGELVIAESMVTSNVDIEGLELENFERSAHYLRRIIMDLQDVAMAVRMVPLTKTFRKMIRLVHDLSRKAGKQVRLELLGEETEVDKTVIEQIADPLVHIIRNSVDHGLEPPDERRAQGKPETGTVLVQAMHEGGEVLIRIQDDGRGLNRDRILSKAMERGLVRGDGGSMSDSEVCKLIFEPGFSTAEKITDVSGRGVGMDVVKRNLEKIKGRVDIHSIPGQGSTFVLRIPLTLAIIDGMLVRVGASRYTIPLLSIRESFRPTMDRVTVTMDGQEVVRVREELIPVLRLHKLYRTGADHENLDQGILVIVSSGERTVCLLVDEILGHHQTVIKPIPNYIGSARGLSGCTILGDGSVSLILDVGNLMDMADAVGAETCWEQGGPHG